MELVSTDTLTLSEVNSKYKAINSFSSLACLSFDFVSLHIGSGKRP